MLNKSEVKSQTNLSEAIAYKTLTKVIVEQGTAANAARFDTVKNAERRLRRERRYSRNTGIPGGGWRVTSITSW